MLRKRGQKPSFFRPRKTPLKTATARGGIDLYCLVKVIYSQILKRILRL